MKTVRITESGALERLGSFLEKKQAALADRLQQLLDSFSPRDIAQPDGTVWPAPEGTGAGTFTVEPMPAQAGKEMVYVSDGAGMEVMVDPMVAIPYLQNVPPEGITPEKIWDLLNEASAETDTSNMLFSPQDEAAEAAWGQQFQARRREADVSNETWDKFERLRELMGDQMLLEELVRAMSGKEAEENFDFIIQMHDLGREFGGEVEEGEELYDPIR